MAPGRHIASCRVDPANVWCDIKECQSSIVLTEMNTIVFKSSRQE